MHKNKYFIQKTKGVNFLFSLKEKLDYIKTISF